jgi:membrane protease subunit HflC
MRTALILIVVLVLIVVAASSVYTVDRAEYVYVTQFGQHQATHDGAADGGLHFKLPWPVQSVQRLDRRLQHFDLPETELLTHDASGQTIDKTITVVAYVCWRIADPDSVDWFIRRVGQPDRARTILGERIRSQLGAAIGRMKMDDLFSTDPGKVERNLEELRQRLLYGREDAGNAAADDSLKARARKDYGIDLVDIRLRRTNHPEAVRQAIFTRIRSEREKKAAEYESAGRKLAQDIASAAERKASEIRSEARAEEKRLKGQAEAEADYIRNQAHSKDVEFYAFLKKLEEYQRILGDNKSMLLLSSHRDLFDVLLQPPRPGGKAESTAKTPRAPRKTP